MPGLHKIVPKLLFRHEQSYIVRRYRLWCCKSAMQGCCFMAHTNMCGFHKWCSIIQTAYCSCACRRPGKHSELFCDECQKLTFTPCRINKPECLHYVIAAECPPNGAGIFCCKNASAPALQSGLCCAPGPAAGLNLRSGMPSLLRELQSHADSLHLHSAPNRAAEALLVIAASFSALRQIWHSSQFHYRAGHTQNAHLAHLLLTPGPKTAFST